jgi:aldehyde dehydrogenase (NAD+)
MTQVTAHDLDLGEARPLIGADRLDSTTGGTMDHHYAGNGQRNGLVRLAGAEEVDAAVRRAQRAHPAWRAMSGSERRALLTQLANLIRSNTEEFARIATLEMGAAAVISKWTAPMASSWFDYYAGWADKIEGSVNPVSTVPGFDYVLREPYGVVGLIVAWNGPLFFLGMKAAPALAAGNCVVIKPSELAPYSTIRFAELALEAGIPEGVVNVVPGAAEAGDAMVRHPGIGKLSFTGSVATAQKIIQSSAATVKPLTLELGGKSANLIFADADLDRAVPHAAMYGLGLNSGQGCACGTRILVQDAVHDEVVDRLAAFVGALPVGDPFDESTIIAPLVSAAARDRVCGLIDRAVADGTSLVVGGGRPGGDLTDGYFVEPTIFDNVPVDSEIAQTEVFGPVVAVTSFKDAEEAVRIANATDYGLAAYISSSNVSTVHGVASALAAGSIWVNGDPQMDPAAPFGGYRASGYGREGGRSGLEEFLQTKNVFLGLPDLPAMLHNA